MVHNRDGDSKIDNTAPASSDNVISTVSQEAPRAILGDCAKEINLSCAAQLSRDLFPNNLPC